MRRSLLALALLMLPASSLRAADQVVGTLTVHGKTTTFQHVYASMESEPEQPAQKYLVILLSDAPLVAGDRFSAHLAALAREGKIHALKVRWHVGYDGLAVVPYHAGIPQTGTSVQGLGMIDLEELSDEKVAVKLASHKLGQDWQYSASVHADLHAGGTVEIEPDAEEVAVSPEPQAGEVGDPRLAVKKELGGLGYEFTTDGFLSAVWDGHLAGAKP